MDESEIALRMAELALSTSRAELFDDAVKIGIPSIVAIVGIVSTYFLTKSGHEKDLQIEALRAAHDVQKEVHTRTGDLIQSITTGLSGLHQSMLVYANNLYAKLNMEREGSTFPEKNRKELSAQYQAFVDALHDRFSIEAQVYLLGQKDVDRSFVNYQSALSELSTNFVPSVSSDVLEGLQRSLLKLRDLREALFYSLAGMYLINEALR